jgi:hypothetical protein
MSLIWDSQCGVHNNFWNYFFISYFFNIPTNAHNIYTLKSTKIHIKNT